MKGLVRRTTGLTLGATSLVAGATSLRRGLSSLAPGAGGGDSVTISLQSGVGYAGSVYESSAAGQWTADGSGIPGETGTTYTMDVENEGKRISQAGALNGHELWVPTDLDAAYKTNGGWYNYRNSALITETGGSISQVNDGFATRHMKQATGARQPTYSSGSAVWPLSDSDVGLEPNAAFSPAYFAAVMTFDDGSVSIFPTVNSFWSIRSAGYTERRIGGKEGFATLLPTSGWASVARKNALPANATVLPLPKSLVEVDGGTPDSQVWGLGSPNNTRRAWRGPRFEELLLGVAPTGSVLAQVQGYLMWANGLSADIPAGHTYKAAPPTVEAL